MRLDAAPPIHRLKMDNSQASNNSFLDMLNGSSSEMNWGGTPDFSPIGEQMTVPTQDFSMAEKPKAKKGGSKGPNWSSHEDELLIEAWANTGLDAVVGTDQHSDSYWGRITEYYNNHKKPSWPVRPQSSVNSRYTTISSATSKFCGCLQQIINRNESGRTIDERRDDAHLLYIQLDPKKRQFPFMHCYLKFSKYPKWETRESEVSQKKQKKKSDASPNTTSSDEDFGVSPTIIEREERPSGTKHEKEHLRRGKAHVSDGSACKISLETVWAQKQEKDEIKEIAKVARYAMAFELQKQEIALKEKDVALKEKDDARNEREDARKQFELDERIMGIDTSGMNVLQKQFYEDKQLEIITRRRQ